MPGAYGEWVVQTFGARPCRVEALKFYREHLKYLQGAIAEEQKVALESALPTAFVTFR